MARLWGSAADFYLCHDLICVQIFKGVRPTPFKQQSGCGILGGGVCMPDLGVKHEGYVERHWLDYDETLRNDAFLQDIFTAARADAAITLTRGGVFSDPSGKRSIARNIRSDSCFEGKTHCIVFPETACKYYFSVDFMFSIFSAVWLCLPLFPTQNMRRCSSLLYRYTSEAFCSQVFRSVKCYNLITNHQCCLTCTHLGLLTERPAEVF